MFYKIAGKRIRDIRIYKEYTVGKLAGEANISEKFLYKIEAGKTGFSAKVLNDIAIALEVDCDYIINGREDIRSTILLETIKRFSENEQKAVERILLEVRNIKDSVKNK